MTREWFFRYIENVSTEACSANLSSHQPTVYRIFPRTGAKDSTTWVNIFGHHFEGGVCTGVKCKFGMKESVNSRFVDTGHIQCEAPMPEVTSGETTVAVMLSLKNGTEYWDTQFNFTYTHNAPPPATTPRESTVAPVASGIVLFGNKGTLLSILLTFYCFYF